MPELTLSLCLSELAKNIKEDDHYGIKIGASSLILDVSSEYEHIMPNSYTVTGWDNTVEHFTDLIDAINYFIEINKR